MSEINYCQNLWAQVAKAREAQQKCTDIFGLANREGGSSVADIEGVVTNFDNEVRELHEVWDSCFVTLRDGRLLFGPEFEALNKLATKFVRNSNSMGYFYSEQIKISKEGHIVGIGLENSQLADLDDMSSFTKLGRLYVEDPVNTDLSPLKHLNSLWSLYVLSNGIGNDDLEAIANLHNLRLLTLSSTEISDISILRNLTKLRSLDIIGTSVSDIKIIEQFQDLRELDISNTKVSDISVLAKLPNLRRLSITQTEIKDHSVLRKLPSLSYLQIEPDDIENEEGGQDLIDELKARGVKVDGF